MKKKSKFKRGLTMLLLLAILAGSAYMIYSIFLLKDIETTLRMCAIGFIALLFIIFFFLRRRIIKKGKTKSFVLLTLFMLIYSAILGLACYEFNVIYGNLSNVTSSGYTIYSSSIVTTSDNKAESISDIGNAKIGIIKDKENMEGYIIPHEIIKKNKLKNKLTNYENYIEMINALQDGKIDFIFLPTKYTSMFKSMEGYENLDQTTKIIYTQTKKVKNKTRINRKGKLTEPFTILLMGVDSEEENIEGASFNGDSLMLITFNPKTLNATILSIPRDSYVPIACFNGQRKNKITHAAWYGEDCMMKTIQNFTGIDIDYYVKINFKGVVKLVDSLGGITVDVPIEFCEQDSNRSFDNQICLQEGKQKLNGEAALALSRHRKTIDDFVRGQNQQLVVQGILNQLKNVKDLSTINKLLSTISNNMETNMSTNEILSLYNIVEDLKGQKELKKQPLSELINFQRLYLSGSDASIYDYSSITGEGTGLNLYNFVPYQGSIDDVVDAMKVNLGLKKPKKIKSFSFSVDKPYEENIIGKGEYSESGVTLVPSFIGSNSSVATSWGSQYGIPVNVQYVNATSPGQFIGQIIDQSLPANMDIDAVNKGAGMTITVIETAYVGNTNTSKQSKTTTETKTEEPATTDDTPEDTGQDIINPDDGSINTEQP